MISIFFLTPCILMSNLLIFFLDICRDFLFRSHGESDLKYHKGISKRSERNLSKLYKTSPSKSS